MNSLVHIVPQLPPAIGGVGDYCRNLWQHWPEPQPGWTFFVMHGAAETRATWPEVSVPEFRPGKAPLAVALEQSESDTVVLHYVSYGFHPKGIPLWLPGAFREWKHAAPERRLVTMFHEMYARSSPLRSPFWVMPWARRIIRDLARLSDLWVTSCERFSDQLTAEFAADPERGRIIPIGSNIPVVSRRNAAVDRESRKLNIVLFGLAKTRLWALERHWRLLRALVAANLVNAITLAGRRIELLEDERAWKCFAEKIGTVRWERRFDLSAAELSALLAQNHVGLIANEPDALTKSGVFAALTSHGVVPVMAAHPSDLLTGPLDCVAIANTDESERVASILSLLSEPATLRSSRDAAMSFAARELAWPRITASWEEFLMRLGSSASINGRARCPHRAGPRETHEPIVVSHARRDGDIAPYQPAPSS